MEVKGAREGTEEDGGGRQSRGHQQRGEGHNQFHREEEEEKAQVDREDRGKGRKELPEESSITVELIAK
ncbi:hypothetical protein INR49_009237 [Caranx melampygus]|nr:hypothetical protein INR49_009237 [Caranx melampygus]